MLAESIIPTTRAERAEAYADLYEVPMEELYRRFGAVLLPRPALGHQPTLKSAEVVRG